MIVMQLVCPLVLAPRSERVLLRSLLVHKHPVIWIAKVLHGAPAADELTKTVRMFGDSCLYRMLWMF